MKAFNLFIVFLFNFILLNQLGFSQEEAHDYEMAIRNNSATNSGNRELRVLIHPVSMVFRGRDFNNIKRYDLIAELPQNSPPYEFNYINGKSKNEYYFTIAPYTPPNPPNKIAINHDNVPGSSTCVAAVGFGIYKIEFYWGNNYPPNDPPDDTCWIEYDGGVNSDIDFNFFDNNSNPRIEVAWNGCSEYKTLAQVNHYLKSWDRICSGLQRSKDIGNFIYDNNVNSYFVDKFPFDSRIDCNVPGIGNENQNFNSELSGQLSLFLSIQRNISTRSNFYDPNFERYFAKKYYSPSRSETRTLQ